MAEDTTCECGATIVQSGKGRPRKWCETCRPPGSKKSTKRPAKKAPAKKAAKRPAERPAPEATDRADLGRLVVAAASGDTRAALEALRDRLAVEVEREVLSGFCPVCKRGSSSVPSLAKQLTDVLARLDAFPAEEASLVDDLAARRAARRAAATGGATP